MKCATGRHTRFQRQCRKACRSGRVSVAAARPGTADARKQFGRNATSCRNLRSSLAPRKVGANPAKVFSDIRLCCACNCSRACSVPPSVGFVLLQPLLHESAAMRSICHAAEGRSRQFLGQRNCLVWGTRRAGEKAYIESVSSSASNPKRPLSAWGLKQMPQRENRLGRAVRGGARFGRIQTAANTVVRPNCGTRRCPWLEKSGRDSRRPYGTEHLGRRLGTHVFPNPKIMDVVFQNRVEAF